jgi:hypothetical protein
LGGSGEIAQDVLEGDAVSGSDQSLFSHCGDKLVGVAEEFLLGLHHRRRQPRGVVELGGGGLQPVPGMPDLAGECRGGLDIRQGQHLLLTGRPGEIAGPAPSRVTYVPGQARDLEQTADGPVGGVGAAFEPVRNAVQQRVETEHMRHIFLHQRLVALRARQPIGLVQSRISRGEIGRELVEGRDRMILFGISRRIMRGPRSRQRIGQHAPRAGDVGEHLRVGRLVRQQRRHLRATSDGQMFGRLKQRAHGGRQIGGLAGIAIVAPFSRDEHRGGDRNDHGHRGNAHQE